MSEVKPHLHTTGRFELERDGHVAYLDYSLGAGVLSLIHTEVPEALRGTGIGSELVQSALEYARENHLRVDVVCPFVAAFIERHAEYADLVMK